MYNELYKAWKSEKSSETPQPLPSDFYSRAAGYLKGLEQDRASRNGQTIQERLLSKEKEIATRLLSELRETRLRKIISAAQNNQSITVGDLTDEEKKLLQNLKSSIAPFSEERLETEETDSAHEIRPELEIVRFLKDIPEIVGVDLKIYGPYKKEDVGSLPEQNAQALIKQGAAKPIEVASTVKENAAS